MAALDFTAFTFYRKHLKNKFKILEIKGLIRGTKVCLAMHVLHAPMFLSFKEYNKLADLNRIL